MLEPHPVYLSNNYGHRETSQHLQHSSGIQAESDAVLLLRKHVADGEWMLVRRCFLL